MFESFQQRDVATSELLNKSRAFIMDVLVLLLVSAFLYSLLVIARQWNAPLQEKVEINLSLWALPGYAFFSLLRGVLAYILAFLFTMIYGYIAVHRPNADRILIPLLDILQSIPVLGFLPSAVLAFVAIFPNSNMGLELACILMIFTGQVWNMTFSFYQSLKTIPQDLLEASSIYQFNLWQRFVRVELPASAMSLTWNSMMSMAGGWFFLMICEAFTLGQRDFRLPGLGAYMSVAVAQKNIAAILSGIGTMMLMILLFNYGVWRPLIFWAQKFRIEEGATPALGRSRIFDIFSRSRVWNILLIKVARPISEFLATTAVSKTPLRLIQPKSWLKRLLGYLSLIGVFFGAGYFVIQLSHMLMGMSWLLWMKVILGTLWTLLRVTSAIVLGSLWTVPLGIWIGSKASRTDRWQPIVQLAASFPAPMLYPLVVIGIKFLGGNLNITSIILMMLGTQWYILFNVIAGASALPNEYREVLKSFQFNRMQAWRYVWLPAIFPSLITGWVTSAGGAWNASIIAEYIQIGNDSFVVNGLGSLISDAAAQGHFDLLASGVIMMAITVVAINRNVWKPLYRLAETKFSR